MYWCNTILASVLEVMKMINCQPIIACIIQKTYSPGLGVVVAAGLGPFLAGVLRALCVGVRLSN